MGVYEEYIEFDDEETSENDCSSKALGRGNAMKEDMLFSMNQRIFDNKYATWDAV
ncbi:MAG: hypothetical protein ACLUD2_13045 [Clostridium sp.]